MVKQVLNYHDIQLYDSDLELFMGPQWWNDNVLNFSLMILSKTICPASSQYLFVDPTVLSFLMFQCDDIEEQTQVIKSWDLMTKEIVFIPINDSTSLTSQGSHWALLVYRRQLNEFQYYDSSEKANLEPAKSITQVISLVLAETPSFKCIQPSPQQTNGYDCGAFVYTIAKWICLAANGLETSVMEYVTADTVKNERKALLDAAHKLIH